MTDRAREFASGKPVISEMSDDKFRSLVAVLPEKRLVPDYQIKVRCEKICEAYRCSGAPKGFVPPFEDVAYLCRRVTRHARALRKLLDSNSDKTVRSLMSVEMIPNHLGRRQVGRVAKRLPGLLDQLNWIIELCQRPDATGQVPDLWKLVRGPKRKGARPHSAKRRLVEELWSLFLATTRQVPTRRMNGPFMEFAREFTKVFGLFDVTESMIERQVRRIIENQKADPNPSAARINDSAKSGIASRRHPLKKTTIRSQRSH